MDGSNEGYDRKKGNVKAGHEGTTMEGKVEGRGRHLMPL
jgi:hypothetical protein